MKVRISDISPQGLELKDTLSHEQLNNRMTEGRGNDIVFTASPKAELHISRTIGGAEVTGKVYGTVRQPCATCSREVEHAVEAPIALMAKERPPTQRRRGERPSAEDQELYSDDVGIMFFEGEHVELEEVIQEALILSLSPFWRPECDQSGSCVECGEQCGKAQRLGAADDTTERVTLGSLLSKAGVKGR